jgi:hypothetical protein
MFELFRLGADWWIVALLILLLMGPVGFYLAGPWIFRREEILEGLSPTAKQLYFQTFHGDPMDRTAVDRKGVTRRRPMKRGLTAEEVDAEFEKYYMQRFGRGWYVLVRSSSVVSLPYRWNWSRMDYRLRPRLDETSARHARRSRRHQCRRPGWRLCVGRRGSARSMAIPGSFAVLGSFPSQSISTLARRFARRTMNLGADTDQEAESELEKLQGIDTRIAERFADEGVTTIVQLAYADPIELTMRCASFSFSFVVDSISQALAWIYLSDNLPKLRACSLRGAQEIASLIDELDGDDEEPKRRARATVDVAARTAGVDAVAFERTLREIAEDPYANFLRNVWADSLPEETSVAMLT